MIAAPCPPADRLQTLALGRLSDEQSDQLFAHVRDCDACRSGLEEIQDGDDSRVAVLRSPNDLAHFDEEPDCQVAIAKALAALTDSGDAESQSTSPRLPQTIGEYEVLRPLGRGGMGSVFLARHNKLGRLVALKVMTGHRFADSRMRDRFDAEMRAVGKLSHSNVVTAHDAREVDETAALGYTHRQGFVHRDVKPSNVMLSRDGEVKLLDLGLARFQFQTAESDDATADELADIGMTGTVQTMGTADYIAPEQVTDSRNVDVRADLYSLGCTPLREFADLEVAEFDRASLRL